MGLPKSYPQGPPKQRCNRCSHIFTLDQFTDRKNTTEMVCNACWNYQCGGWKREQALDTAGELLIPAAKQEVNLGAVADMAAEVVHAFGGIGNFARRWVGQIEYAENAQPGSTRVLNAYAGVFKLFTQAASAIAERQEVSDMSDEELAHALARIAKSGVYQELMQDEQPAPRPIAPPADGGDGSGAKAPLAGGAARLSSDRGTGEVPPVVVHGTLDPGGEPLGQERGGGDGVR